MAGEVPEYWELRLDFPVRPAPRYGYGKPAHGRLSRILGRNRDRYRETLENLLRYREELARIPVEGPSDGQDYWWNCGWLGGLDIAALYSFVCERKPAWYAEVGSGFSTKFIKRAIEDHGLSTRILSIDPNPRHAVDAICDEAIRRPLEDVDPGVFDRLASGDMLFVDGTHRCLTNSDVAVVFLDLLPELPPGVLVGIDDIFLPFDYPPKWHDRFYSEQYVLAAYLLAEGGRSEIVLPCSFVGADPELRDVVEPLWADPRLQAVDTESTTFWMVTR